MMQCFYSCYFMKQCVSMGLVFGSVVFIADLYFLVRTDLVAPKHVQKKKIKEKKD